jgi:prepilin-type N-terminal cleavage/methylation domain-containing protein
MKIKTHPGHAGFTLVEIMIVVAIIGMLAAIAIPNYRQARDKARQTTCISNLQRLEGAVDQWALEAKKETGQPVQYSDISGYLRNSVVCPAGGTSFADSYQLTSVDAEPVCLKVPSGQYAHKLRL